MPTSPTDRRQETVDPPPSGYRCPICGEHHQPIRLGGGGAAAAYSRTLMAEAGQRGPTPIGSGPAHTAALVRDGFSPWRASPAAEPIPPALTLRERLAVLWFGDNPGP
jgi:hypothetical protein